MGMRHRDAPIGFSAAAFEDEQANKYPYQTVLDQWPNRQSWCLEPHRWGSILLIVR